MTHPHTFAKTTRWAVYWLFAFLAMAAVPGLRAQTTAALSGRVVDPSSAVVPGASVTITNQSTNDKTHTVTSADGTYSFPVLLPGTYSVSVEAKGFRPVKQEGLTVYAGSRVAAPDSILAVGNVSDSVTVSTNSNILITDNGSLGSTLDAKDIDELALVGRNADELLKVLPGVTTVPNGTGNGQNFNESAADVETSVVGAGVSIDGTPFHGGVSVLYDGADINDPGCNCNTVVAVNTEMVQEVSVLTSSYGADVAHGPIIVENVSKSGGDRFHGSGYFYAKNDVLNANDWVSNNLGHPRGTAHYYFPGGNVGGPVPFTQKRLRFWFGYERFLQNTGNAATLTSYIPSSDMLSGNFTSTAANSALCGNTGISSTVTGTYCNDLTGTILPDGTIIGVTPGRPAGMIPAQFLSTPAAQNGLALTKIWPMANTTPTSTNAYINYSLAVPGVIDGYLYRTRVDYSFTDRTKAYVSYQYGYESSPANGAGAHIYWTPGNSIPFPGGGLVSTEKSSQWAGHFIHIFSNTLTNEAIATLGKGNNATSVPSVADLSKSKLGYTGGTIFNTGDPLIPAYNSAGNQTFPDHSQQDIFSNGSYNLIKPMPSLEDNLIKVLGDHTLKTGVFYEMIDNNQGGFNTPNGSLSFNGTTANNAVTGQQQGSPNNPLANLLLGNASSYYENSSNPNQDIAYKVISFYLDDSWKATKRLNVEAGLRFDHIGRWYDRANSGIPVFLPARVANDFASGIVNPGLQYHAINSAVPKSGIASTPILLSPRVGGSYDLFGTGKTLVRGGFGVYRFGDNWGDYSGGLGTSQGVLSYNLPSATSVRLDQIGFSSAPALTPQGAGSGTIESAVNPDDHGNPTTYSYNFTISQRAKFNTLFEISYVGNQTKNLLLGGGSDATLTAGSGLTNINKTPLGAFFKPDPVTGITAPNPEDVTHDLQGNPLPNKPADYRPYGYAYGTNNIYILSHTGYSNYNAVQMALTKQSARLNMNLNYTWEKTLGTDLNEDPFTLRGNYGPEITDRPQILNTSFSYNNLRMFTGENKLIAGAVNNWLISANTTYQSGGNLQALASPNFYLSDTYSGTLPAGVHTGISGASYFGTDAGVSIQPLATCNPNSGRAHNQYVTDKCFALPAIGSGVNGPRVYPYIKGPAYFDSDLALAKTFHVTEGQTVQFRASAFDWLNHPLNAYNGQQLNLYFNTNYASKASTLSSQTASNFGSTNGYHQGGDTRRILELEVKYAF
jgi:hypothetical protein